MRIYLLFFSYSFDRFIEVCNGGILQYEALDAGADKSEHFLVCFVRTWFVSGRSLAANR